jgi:O-antigen/teichoic acid export membrane protein
MSLARRIGLNVSSSYASLFVGMAVAFFLRPFLIDRLGDAEYGVWTLITCLTGYLGLMDLGIRSSLVKFVAQHSGEEDPGALNRAVSTGFFVNAALGALGICAVAVFVPLVGTVFGANIPPEILGRARIALLVVGVQMALSLPLSVYCQAIAGFQRYEITNGIRIIVTLCQAVCVVIFILEGFRVLMLAVLTFVFRTSEFLIAGWVVQVKWKEVQVRLRQFSVQTARILFPYSIWAFVFHCVDQVIYLTDAAVVSYVGKIEDCTLYSNAAVLLVYLHQLVYPGNVFCPAVSHLEARGDMDQLRELWLRGSRYLSLLILPGAMGLLLFGRPFLSLWLGVDDTGRGYEVTGYPVLVILLTHGFFVFPHYVSRSVMFGMNRHKWPAVVGAVNAVLNLVLSLWWGRLYGLIGVAAGTAVPVTLSYWLFYPWYYCRVLGVSVRVYLVRSFLRPYACLVPMVVVGVTLMLLFYPVSWSVFLAQVLVTSVAYLAGAWWIGLGGEERQRLLARVLRRGGGEGDR